TMQPSKPENPRRTARLTRLTTRERLLPTSCPCAYPTLPIKKRLAQTAVFIRDLFHARFPGTTTGMATTPIMVGAQSLGNLNIESGATSEQSRNTPYYE